MINTLSPYYINTPLIDPSNGFVCQDYTLNLYIWNGAKGNPPSTPTYSISKQNITQSSGIDKINIARFINDFIDFNPAFSLDSVNAGNQVWCKTSMAYDGGAGEYDTFYLCVKGYGYGMSGENPQSPTNRVLISGDEFKVSREGKFILPVMINEVTNGLPLATIKSYPSNEINKTLAEKTSVDSARMIQNICVDLSATSNDRYVEITFNNKVVTLVITDEHKHKPLDIAFQNKLGGLQLITFFKEKLESMTIFSDEFESDRGQPLQGNHQHVTYNVQGKSKFKMNSGFVDESMNETFKQLMLSERVWSFENNIFTPLRLGSRSIEYKTRLKERLVNYEIEFEYAFNELNNI